MNWLIDGAHGDLYRTAMDFHPLAPATDEWQIERQGKPNLPRPPRKVRSLIQALRHHLASTSLTASFKERTVS